MSTSGAQTVAGLAGGPRRIMACFVLVAMLGVSLVVGVSTGARPLAPSVLLDAVTAFDSINFDHVALWRFRLPRVIGAAAVGAALAVSGALLQSLVRNALAEPQLLGLNAGAVLAVVSVSLFGLPEIAGLRPIAAAAGAAGAFGLVLAITNLGRSGPTPLKLVLCGVVISAFASALSSGLLLIDDRALEDVRLWLSGDLGGQSFYELAAVAPFMVAGLVGAVLLAPRLDALALGDAAASGLGVRPGWTRLATAMAAALLAGAAVTLAGPIGCIGLIVHHLMRPLFGSALRWVVLGCVLAGASLLVLVDALARSLLAPVEISTGVVTGAAGAIIFIYIVARYIR